MQIALRKQNCGTTYYDIYQKPSGQCSPPTAIPGTSRHERGLAIDFANCQVGTATYNWLKAHGASYRLINLPSVR
jgi:LAS superfamily LD-carboxypeptidase LdcB